MKKIIYSLCFLLAFNIGHAQQENFGWRLGLGVTKTNYFGDLSDSPNAELKNHYTTFDKEIGYTASIESRLSPSWSFMIDANKGSFKARDIDHPESDNFSRRLNAKTEFFDLGISFELRADNDKFFAANSIIAPYLFFGGGITKFKVYADLKDGAGSYYNYNGQSLPSLDEDYETEVTNIHSEKSDDYFTLVPNVAAGLGLRFRLAPRLSLHIQSKLNYAFTDFLDDVSGKYRIDINPTENDLLSYAADPTLNPANLGQERGNNSVLKDMYLNSSLSLRYNFGKQKYSFKYPVFYSSNYPTDEYKPNPLELWQNETPVEADKKMSRAERRAEKKAARDQEKLARKDAKKAGKQKKQKDEKVVVINKEVEDNAPVISDKKVEEIVIEKKEIINSPKLDSLQFSVKQLQNMLAKMQIQNDSLSKNLKNANAPVVNNINVGNGAADSKNEDLSRDIERLNDKMDNFLMQLAIKGMQSPQAPPPPAISPAPAPAPITIHSNSPNEANQLLQQQLLLDMQRSLKLIEERMNSMEKEIQKNKPKEGGFISPETPKYIQQQNPTPAPSGVAFTNPVVTTPPTVKPIENTLPPSTISTTPPTSIDKPSEIVSAVTNPINTSTNNTVNFGKYYTDFSNENIYFDLNAYKIKSDERTKLENMAGILKLNPFLKMKLMGFCDVTGSDAYNKKLAEERVNAVYRFLTSTYGVSPVQLIKLPMGKVDKNRATGNDALDRRVEMIWER